MLKACTPVHSAAARESLEKHCAESQNVDQMKGVELLCGSGHGQWLKLFLNGVPLTAPGSL